MVRYVNLQRHRIEYGHVGLPYNSIDNPEFKQLLSCTTGMDVTKPSRDSYNSMIDCEYARFTTAAAKMLQEAHKECRTLPFLTILHDLYLDNGGHGVIGASAAFISRNWTLHHVALMAQRHSGDHKSATVADAVKSFCLERYNCNVYDMAKFVMSDTACKLLRIGKG
jgi:hypothetical protein